ncbi:hypothetical protein CGMCC3_g10344 [Colletotrichum fructicola]|nr:uncharacterized protein CGMCC3_g10344 [Colletotrichum fructicola]KAE9573468.1 hypothetical protein CGMCC3_g10344 [Colletotrichum fructicola]
MKKQPTTPSSSPSRIAFVMTIDAFLGLYATLLDEVD